MFGKNLNASVQDAASTGVSYNLSEDAIIEAFKDACPDGELDDMKDRFEAFNEQGYPMTSV